jgi:hypothetical protein
MTYINNNQATEEMKITTRKAKRILRDYFKNTEGIKVEGLTHKYNLWEATGWRANPDCPAAIISLANARPMPTRAVIDAAVEYLSDEIDYPVIQRGNKVIVRFGSVGDIPQDGGNDRTTFITLAEIVGEEL